MSDATRWFVEGGIVYRLDPGEVPGRGYLAESDHLAAIDRLIDATTTPVEGS